MKKSVLVILLIIPLISLGIFGYLNYKTANLRENLEYCKEAHLSCLSEKEGFVGPAQELLDEDLKEYLELKTLKEKYLKADELMAKAFQTFMIIQGIRFTKTQQDWAYQNDELRKQALTEEWEHAGQSTSTSDSPTSVSEITYSIPEKQPTPIASISPNKNIHQLPGLNKAQEAFWKKYFNLGKYNSTLVNQTKLNFIKGEFKGTFRSKSGLEFPFLFKLNFPETENIPDNEMKASIHIESIANNNTNPSSETLYLNDNFRVYQVNKSPLSDYYVLKNHMNQNEIHLSFNLSRKQVLGKIYFPSLEKSSGTENSKKLGDFYFYFK